jgi:pimeloyl-ACP methyl ester carboxylesterase
MKERDVYQHIATKKEYAVESSVGDISVVEVIPADLKHENPVVSALGWSERPVVFATAQKYLADQGWRTLCLDHPRNKGKVELKTDYPQYPITELRKAEALLEVVKNTIGDVEDGKVNVIAHSEGAVYSMIAASISPDIFDNIVVVGPAGMMGSDNILALAKRFTEKAVSGILEAIPDEDVNIETLKSSVKKILKNPLKSFREAYAASKKYQPVAKNIVFNPFSSLKNAVNISRDMYRFSRKIVDQDLADLQPEENEQIIKEVYHLAERVVGRDLLDSNTEANEQINQDAPDLGLTLRVIQSNVSAIKYIAANPIRALCEAYTLSRYFVHEDFARLKSQGVGLVMIHHADDYGFPVGRIQDVAKDDQFDGVLVVTGEHDSLFIEPEKYTMAAHEMLVALEKTPKKAIS